MKEVNKMKSKRGFTLIEMMIVVAIIALLATIAIPNYISFQLRAKTSEAKSNLGAIRTCEEAYRAENDVYYACGNNPTSIPVGIKAAWTSTAAGWTDIGFEPKGNVYFQYAVTVGGGGTTFAATATGDLDGDASAYSVYTLDQDGNLTSTNPLE